jgi:hypothetical protein
MAQKTPIVLSNGKTPTDNHGSTKAAWVRQFFEQLHGHKDKHVRCMVMKPFHATRGLVQVGTIANEPLMLSRCDKEYNNTSTDIWIKHVHEKHDIAIPARFEESRGCIEPHQQVLNFARVHGEYDSYSGAKRTRDSQQVRTDAIVLAHCMNPMIPFECTDNPYFRLAYADAAWKDSSIKSAQSLKDAIMDFSARLQVEQKKTVRGICGFQMDAGKDCKSRKLHAAAYMHPSSRRSMVHKLTDTNNEELDEAWHHVYITSTIEDFMSGKKTFVPSLTVDNEASQNAGITTALQTTLPWLLHFRCGNHSIELLLKYLRDNLPASICQGPADAANAVVSAVRNHKQTLKALFDLQTAAGQTPLILVTSCNTRKWSADYLVAQRLLKLQPFVQALYANAQHAALLPPQPDWPQLQRYVGVSFPFYFAEQVLQRDSSNAIHYAHFWTQSRDHAMGLCRELAQQDGFSAAEHDKIRLCVRKIQKRDEKVKSCGVFNLCRILWPDPDQVSPAGWNIIIEELKWLVAKQWDKWVELKDVVQLPWEDDDDLNNQSEFVRRCVLDLSQHRSGDIELIQDGRQAFRRAIQSARREYESAECYAKPKSSKSLIWQSNVQAYWSTLRYSCPAIYFVHHLLSHCCATEAGTERMFSSEKLIHSLIRNQLAPDLVRAIMTIRWNYEAIQQFQGNLVQRDADGAVGEDVEFVPYE